MFDVEEKEFGKRNYKSAAGLEKNLFLKPKKKLEKGNLSWL